MFELKKVESPRDLKCFVNFPSRLYKNNKYWIPPLKKDEYKQLNPAINPSFKSCDACFWIAVRNKQCVGRIGAIINHDYNSKTGKLNGRINRVEFIDDKSVSSLLFKQAETWLKQKGMNEVHGPLGFNNLDNQGLLIDGFDFLPSVASVYHLPYYQKHFEEYGYTKENDWIEFRLTVGEAAQEKARRGSEIVKKRFGLMVKSFKSPDEIKKHLFPVFHLLNSAFHELPYVSPFSDEMIRYIGDKYFKVLNPDFVKVIFKDDQVIAFIVGVPSLSEAMQKANGKLFPLGFYHLLKALKNPEVIDLYLTAVAPEYQSSGAAVVLIAELQNEMLRRGINQIETTGIFETNHNAITNWKNYEHIQHKRRRCFVKTL
jgi:hypothetical protein